MRYHLDLSRNATAETGLGLVDAARLVGRLKAASGGGFYSLGEDEILRRCAEVVAGTPGDVYAEGLLLRDDGDRGDFFDDVVDGFRGVMWASAWANAEEEAGRTYPGSNLLDVAPSAPPEAEAEAAFQVGYQEGVARRTVDGIWGAALAAALAEGHREGDRLNPERFGECLYFSSVGDGVSWEDDFPAVPGFDPSHVEITIDAALDREYGLDGKSAVRIAYSYASMVDSADPGMILESFASLGGVVENEVNRARLMRYLRDEIIPAARQNDERGDTDPVFGDTEVEDIEALIDFVDRLEVGPRPERTPAFSPAP